MVGEDDPDGYKFTLEFRVGDETGVCSDGSSSTAAPAAQTEFGPGKAETKVIWLGTTM